MKQTTEQMLDQIVANQHSGLGVILNALLRMETRLMAVTQGQLNDLATQLQGLDTDLTNRDNTLEQGLQKVFNELEQAKTNGNNLDLQSVQNSLTSLINNHKEQRPSITSTLQQLDDLNQDAAPAAGTSGTVVSNVPDNTPPATDTPAPAPSTDAPAPAPSTDVPVGNTVTTEGTPDTASINGTPVPADSAAPVNGDNSEQIGVNPDAAGSQQ